MYPYRFSEGNIFSTEGAAAQYGSKVLMERLQRFWADNQGEGDLSIQISTAQGALPVKSARVTVTKDLGNGYGLTFTVLADENGNIGRLRLPAPSRALRMVNPYTAYDVQISAPGYVTRRLVDVALIDGITSQQPVELQPMLVRGLLE